MKKKIRIELSLEEAEELQALEEALKNIVGGYMERQQDEEGGVPCNRLFALAGILQSMAEFIKRMTFNEMIDVESN